MIFSYAIDHEVELRLLQLSQAGILCELIDQNREYLGRWMPWVENSRSIADTETFIRQSLTLWVENGGFNCGIWYRQELAGCIGLHEVNWYDRETSIGYWLAAAYQGKGIMTRACQGVIQSAFQDLKLNRLSITAAIDNHKSRAIPERLGFRHEATLRQAIWRGNGFTDQVVYGLLASEWQQP